MTPTAGPVRLWMILITVPKNEQLQDQFHPTKLKFSLETVHLGSPNSGPTHCKSFHLSISKDYDHRTNSFREYYLNELSLLLVFRILQSCL